METLPAIETDVLRAAVRIGASGQYLPTYGISRDVGRPHVEVDHGLYHYVVVERGEEIERRSSASYDDLRYWRFRDVTHGRAFSYELQNRIEDQDCRHIAFPKQVELMKQLGQEMGERLKGEISDILRRSPNDDAPTKTVSRMRRNREK